MEAFLMVAGIASWFVSVFTFMVATTPVYTIAAFVMFLIGTVFVVGSAVLMGINRLHDLLDERLPRSPHLEDEQPLRHRIKDWTSWRRDHAATNAQGVSRAAAAYEGAKDDDRPTRPDSRPR
jgi:hypothetical protein